jgi:hypothetical protein
VSANDERPARAVDPQAVGAGDDALAAGLRHRELVYFFLARNFSALPAAILLGV